MQQLALKSKFTCNFILGEGGVHKPWQIPTCLTALCTWVHFLARRRIHTNNYILLHFPKETNTIGKNSDAFYSFHTNVQFRLKKSNFRTITWRISSYDSKQY